MKKTTWEKKTLKKRSQDGNIASDATDQVLSKKKE